MIALVVLPAHRRIPAIEDDRLTFQVEIQPFEHIAASVVTRAHTGYAISRQHRVALGIKISLSYFMIALSYFQRITVWPDFILCGR